MQINKTAFLTILLALLTTGCANTQVKEQQTIISNLESELVLAQTTNQQTKDELVVSTEKVATLSAQLSEKSKTPKPVPVVTTSATTKEINKFDDKTILGQTEWVYISAAKSNFKARIDTGAATSSINAIDIKRFERDGKKWVRFNIAHSEGDQKESIEARIVRVAKIIQTNTPDQASERIVVKLGIRIGDLVQKTEFTLADRVHMEYPTLIGRSFLKDITIVDTSREFIYPKYQNKK